MRFLKFLIFKFCVLSYLFYISYVPSEIYASEVNFEVKKDGINLCSKEQAFRILKSFFGANLFKKIDIKEVNSFKLSEMRDINICEVVYTLDQRESKDDPLLIQILYYGEDFVITGYISKLIGEKFEQVTKQRFTYFNFDFLRGVFYELKESAK